MDPGVAHARLTGSAAPRRGRESARSRPVAWRSRRGSSTGRAVATMLENGLRRIPATAQLAASETRLPGGARAGRPARALAALAAPPPCSPRHCRISSSTSRGSGPRRSHRRPSRSAPWDPGSRGVRGKAGVFRSAVGRAAWVSALAAGRVVARCRSGASGPSAATMSAADSTGSRRRAAAGSCRSAARGRAGCPAPP